VCNTFSNDLPYGYCSSETRNIEVALQAGILVIRLLHGAIRNIGRFILRNIFAERRFIYLEILVSYNILLYAVVDIHANCLSSQQGA
jgi:hypothetical protein